MLELVGPVVAVGVDLDGLARPANAVICDESPAFFAGLVVVTGGVDECFFADFAPPLFCDDVVKRTEAGRFRGAPGPPWAGAWVAWLKCAVVVSFIIHLKQNQPIKWIKWLRGRPGDVGVNAQLIHY